MLWYCLLQKALSGEEKINKHNKTAVGTAFAVPAAVAYILQYLFSNQGVHHLLLAQYPEQIVFLKGQRYVGIGDGEGSTLEADDEAAPFVTQLRILHRGAQKRRMLVDGDSQRQELLLRLLHMAGEHELAQALRRLQLLHAKLALLHSAVENLQLCSGADDQ